MVKMVRAKKNHCYSAVAFDGAIFIKCCASLMINGGPSIASIRQQIKLLLPSAQYHFSGMFFLIFKLKPQKPAGIIFLKTC
jgi:hypothetical protein